jgi:hypothetical protein
VIRTAVTSDTIANYFTRIDWDYRVSSPTRVLTNFRCPVPAYYYGIGIEVVAGQHWVSIRALLQHNISRTQIWSVLQLISQWNRYAYRVRFLLVDDCVILQAEIPSAEFDFPAFYDGLVSVCHYAKLAGVEIATLATNPSLVALFDSVMASVRPSTWDDRATQTDLDIDFDISLNTLPD